MSFEQKMLEERVLWKPLYYTSISMFVLSLLLLPFSPKYSAIMILALVTLWSRVPGFVHFIFNKLSMHDFFTFVVAAYAGVVTGALFAVSIILFSRIFGPQEWFPYTIRTTLSNGIGALFVPFAVGMMGGVNIWAFYIYEICTYIIYYLLVLFIWTDEMYLEIMLIPIVVFFDFYVNGKIFERFSSQLSDLMINGLGSATSIFIFAGIILLFILIARNGEKIARLLGFTKA